MLKFRIALNRLDNVVALCLALGSRIGKTLLFRIGSPHNVISDVATSTPLKTKTLARCWVPIVTLDFLCYKLCCKVKGCDILKLDVEGAEVKVLKGMTKILPHHIVREYHGLDNARRLKSVLEERGYKVLITKPEQSTEIGVFYASHAR